MSDTFTRGWWLRMAVVLAGCVSDEVEPENGEPSGHVRRPSRRSIDQGLLPYQHPALWSFQVSSARVIVHYQAADEQATAQEVLGHVEHAWQVQIDQGGALPPLDDHGAAGPDGRFDVYLERGLKEPYVVGVEPDETTWYEDW